MVQRATGGSLPLGSEGHAFLAGNGGKLLTAVFIREHQGSIMALRRQIRRTGRSLAITIPKDLADLYEVEAGDQAEFEPLGERTFRIKLVRQERE